MSDISTVDPDDWWKTAEKAMLWLANNLGVSIGVIILVVGSILVLYYVIPKLVSSFRGKG